MSPISSEARVYIAAALTLKEAACRWASEIRKSGGSVVSTWHDDPTATVGDDAALTREGRLAVRKACLDQIDASNIVLLLVGDTPRRFNSYIEVGYGMKAGKKICVTQVGRVPVPTLLEGAELLIPLESVEVPAPAAKTEPPEPPAPCEKAQKVARTLVVSNAVQSILPVLIANVPIFTSHEQAALGGPSADIVLDPCCGDGDVVAVLRTAGLRTLGFGTKSESVADRDLADTMRWRDPLDPEPWAKTPADFYAIISAPPPGMEAAITERALAERGGSWSSRRRCSKCIALLLPTKMAMTNRSWHRLDGRASIYVLPEGRSQIEGTEYAWFVWGAWTNGTWRHL